MTTVKILGADTQEQKVRQPIEFKRLIGHNGTVSITDTMPSSWGSVILLGKGGGFDSMYAYNESNPQAGCLYLGHFNDGIV